MRRIEFILAVVLLMIYSVTAAQSSGGQLCVRAFEDRDGNGKLDPGEPLITKGISVNLLDGKNVTINSALLDTSPTAAQGVVCFQGLIAGQYSVSIASADYTATTPDTIATTVSDSGVPAIVEFGGKRPSAETASATTAVTPESQRDQIVRIVVAGLAAIIVIAGMAFFGLIVYWLLFHNRRRPVPDGAVDPRKTTGSMAAVRTRDTGEFPRQ
jgi:hypothetical protein